MKIERSKDQPEVLVKWYDYTKWVLDRVDGFPKNQRFVLGTRLADAVVLVMDRGLISKRQFLHSARALEECGRMVGGWARSLGGPGRTGP